MSFNQSRSDRSENQYRRSGRSASFNQQRTNSGSFPKAGGSGPAPSPSLSSNRSFKKSSNAQGGQSRVNVPTANSSLESSGATAPRGVQNGAQAQPQLQGVSDAPAAKPTNSSTAQRSARNVPKVPSSQSQSASVSSEMLAPTTPAKAPGDASKPFPFQFGSISPGFVNGMQIPARTSSAPPNLDEQKRDQARQESFRPVPSLPIPTVPKQQLQRKDVGAVEQSNTGGAPPIPKAKKGTQVSSAPPATQMQKPSVLPVPGISMPVPFHQAQVSVQFGGPNTQMQSQAMTATSLQMPMPMPLPMGSAPQVQQFVPGLPPHSLQSQGIMHQGQGLSFTSQMGPQLPPRLGNLGIGITPQYPQQQGGNFGGQRKTTVKITHPETHEELKLDKRTDSYTDGGSTDPRSHPNVPPQSQPMPPFAPSHPINYYSNSYNASSLFFPTPGSLPLTGSQIPPNSHAQRFNYPVNQGPQNVSFMNPSAINSFPINKTLSPVHGPAEPSNLEHSRDAHNMITSAPSTVPVIIKPAAGTVGEKIVDSSFSNNSPAVQKGETRKLSGSSEEASLSHRQKDTENSESSLQNFKPGSEQLPAKSFPVATKQSLIVSSVVSVDNRASNSFPSASAAPSEESISGVVNDEGRKKESLSRLNSIKDPQKKVGKKVYIQPQLQAGGQSTSILSIPSRPIKHDLCSNSGVSAAVEAKTSLVPSIVGEGVSVLTRGSMSTTGAATPDTSESNATSVGEGSVCVSSESSGAGGIIDTLETVHHAKLDNSSLHDKQLKRGIVRMEDQGESIFPEGHKQEINSFEISSVPISTILPDLVKQTERESDSKVTAINNDVSTLETAEMGLDEPSNFHAEIERSSDVLDMSSNIVSDFTCAKTVQSTVVLDQRSAFASTPDDLEATSKYDGEGVENIGGGLVSTPVSGSKDKPIPELNRQKSSTTSKGKKKRKEILQKADAAGTTSDLYMAFKGPEEKKDTFMYPESIESTSAIINSKQAPADALQEDGQASKKVEPGKAEPDDWEDADITTPKLETSVNGEQVDGGLVHRDKDGNGNVGKKYSRDFLLKFAEQCTDLPDGFEITSDIADALMSPSVNNPNLVDRDSYPSPGRVIDRPSGGSRSDRRVAAMVDEDRWSKLSGAFGLGRDLRLDIGYGGNAGFRPGQGGNYGVLRNPRAQTPVQYAGGILYGPLQSLAQGGMQRNSPDADRWRAANFQKGLIPSPQTPLQMMHKAERKYEVGKVTDEEQAKQRQLKGILNKLTPQNFEKLFEQVKAVNIDNARTLTRVISQIFDKALMEPTFCEMYANFCHHLAGELPDFSEDNEKITFKRLLLNKCQEEFERGEREQEEANKVDEEGEVKQSEEEREEKRIKARRRMLGNIRLIGELYKKKMLTERIMHECIKKLLGQYQNPDEEDIEALCKLMSTIGEMIDHPKAKEHMDAYFDMMAMLSSNMKLSSRVRFMLRDAIDLRKNKWQQRRKVEGPKKIEEVHRDAAQERQAQARGLARGPGINPSPRRAPMDFGPRGAAMLSSPNGQMGSLRGLPTQVRGFGGQDVRLDERQSYEARTFSVPLPQRPIGDETITLGPQGGLARGMSIRGPLAMPSVPLADVTPSPGDTRRVTAGLNGYSSVTERTPFGPRDDLMQRYIPDRFASPAAYDDQSSAHERNVNYGKWVDRPFATSPPARGQVPGLTQNVPSEKMCSEERLQEMSLAAIKEFYSARDEKEVALCIKDLNSPSFYPSMISLWVTDSFERKDIERDLLAKLLVNLTKSQDGMLSQGQLIKGFESVLTTLEDAVNDAPKAPEFLARIFAKAVLEDVMSLRDIGHLIHEGGEKPGRLLEMGIAADILGSVLETVKSEKGETVLNEIRTNSNLSLESFRPPDPIRSRKLDIFI